MQQERGKIKIVSIIIILYTSIVVKKDIGTFEGLKLMPIFNFAGKI